MTGRIHGFLLALTLLLITSLCSAQSNGTPASVWRVDGAQNSVYLLGTIHLLRESDYPLPTAIDVAFDDADAIVMELDMDDLDPLSTQAIVTELGMIEDERTLADMMGAEMYEDALQHATTNNIPLDMLSRAKPWYAAITIDSMLLTRLGFDATLGIEMYLLAKAQSAGKPVFGLETEREQMEILNGLSPEIQNIMLLQTLADGPGIEETLDGIIAAWRQGDVDSMEQEMLAEMTDYPELLDSLVTRRNTNWVNQIETLLEDDENYLIAVGTMHLVGDIGLPEKLVALGYSVEQLTD